MKQRHAQKLVILSLVLLLAFNIPFLLIFDSSDSALGFPLIYVYIFSIWLMSILISFLIVKRYYE